MGLPDIFQSEPHLRTVRGRGNIRAERARLRDSSDDLMVGDGHNYGLWRKRRADIAVFSVRREDRHAWAVRHNNPRLWLVGRAVEYSNIVFATHRHPDLSAVWCKERFVRRAPDIGYVLYGGGRSIDESDGIRADRDDVDGAAIWRKAQPMHKQLALIKRTETGRRRVTEMDAAEQPVVRRIGNRDSVRVLLRRVNAVHMTDPYFGGGNSERRLARASIPPADKGCRGE